MSTLIIIIIIIVILVAVYKIFLPIFAVIILLLVSYKIYESIYFNSNNFLQIKKDVEVYINECNELNQHIEDLKQSSSVFQKTDYGTAQVADTSIYDYKRKHLDKFSSSKHTFNCSLSVCRNAQRQPYKYISKYFNIEKNEENLEYFEGLLNNFSAVEEGKEYLSSKKKIIMEDVKVKIPSLIKRFSNNKLEEKLGFKKIDFSDLYLPRYTMLYVSDGGNSSMKTEVIFDLKNLEGFINFLAEHIKWRKSVQGQRALMTPKLRARIKQRDNYSCCICSNSTVNEPNLLLEIDHIIPLSKGGMTEIDNLQTLCWKCNRSKGAKIIQ